MKSIENIPTNQNKGKKTNCASGVQNIWQITHIDTSEIALN